MIGITDLFEHNSIVYMNVMCGKYNVLKAGIAQLGEQEPFVRGTNAVLRTASHGWRGRWSSRARCEAMDGRYNVLYAGIAQLVERRIRNA